MIDYLNPGLPAGLEHVAMPVVPATASTLDGYGRLIDDPAACPIEIVRWPAQGTRPVDDDTGDQGGTTEGVFVSEWHGDILYGRNEAVGGHYVLAYATAPEAARTDHATAPRRMLLWHANYHPDGGQLFFPLDRRPFLVPLALPGDDVTPQRFVCFRFDGTRGTAPDGGGEVFDATIEVSVTIRNPEKPIGTHVFTAMARNDAGLRWTAVTIDNGDDAKDALDRITIPQDVLDRIAPTALPRSSIVVSDEPLSRETNYRTEFVAVLSNQPQGGFMTRRPTADVPVASDNVLGRRRLRLLFPAQLELPTWQYASARRPILSSDATALVVRRGTPASRPHGHSGSSAVVAAIFGHVQSSGFRPSRRRSNYGPTSARPVHTWHEPDFRSRRTSHTSIKAARLVSIDWPSCSNVAT